MKRPNILLITTDQQRFDTLAAHINNFPSKTPAIDSLLKRGVLFDNMFCTAPICAPSRASYLTGLYPTKTRLNSNSAPPLPYTIKTIGHRMQDAGYETVYHGKSHLGGDLEHYGFETAYENYDDESTVREASRYWRNRDWLVYKRPFFHVVSLLNPHDIYFLEPEREEPVQLEPWANKDDDLTKKPWPQQKASHQHWSDERWEYYRQFYGSCMEEVDDHIAEILKQHTRGGYGSNTWIIFMTDHGDMCGEHGIGFKGPYMYEGVLKVPFIIVPPNAKMLGSDRGSFGNVSTRVGTCSALCSLIDLVPTILDMAGVEPDPELTGKSVLPAMFSEDFGGHDAVFSEWPADGNYPTPIRSVRTNKWKYNLYHGIGEELYDMENDPNEINNLAGNPEHAQVQADLKQQLLDFLEKEGDTILSTPAPQTPPDIAPVKSGLPQI